MPRHCFAITLIASPVRRDIVNAVMLATGTLNFAGIKGWNVAETEGWKVADTSFSRDGKLTQYL